MLFRTRDVESFLKLFTFSKKRNLERYSRDTVVYGSDFAAIITASDAGRLPFHHGIYRSDIVPPHLVPTKASVGALSRNAMNGVGPLDREGRKAIGKLLTLFDQRRVLGRPLVLHPRATRVAFLLLRPARHGGGRQPLEGRATHSLGELALADPGSSFGLA